MLLHVWTMNDMRTLHGNVGDHWPRPCQGWGVITANQSPAPATLTNQRPLPDLGDKDQPHLLVAAHQTPSLDWLTFTNSDQIKSLVLLPRVHTYTGMMVWLMMMLIETCEGSMNSWPDLTWWPVAILATNSSPAPGHSGHAIVGSDARSWFMIGWVMTSHRPPHEAGGEIVSPEPV